MMELKNKKEKLNNNRNNFNCFGDYDYCFINFGICFNSNANRREPEF